jgi:monoamine oxidase
MNQLLGILLAIALAFGCGRPTPSMPVPSVPAPKAAAEPAERVQVAIVGGGIAGLVTAYELEQSGLSVHVLEMSARLGGRIATAHYGDGLMAEYGMAEIWSKNPLAQIARDLGLALDDSEGALSSVVLDNKLHVYSQDTAEEYLRSLFSADEYAAWQRWTKLAESLHTQLSSSGLTKALAPLNEISFLTWLEEQKLPPRVIAFIRLLLECELGSSAEYFSAVSGLAELRVFLFGGENAQHVQGGNSRVIEALGAKLRGAKTLGARVTAIERSKDARGRLSATVTFIRDDHVQSLTADRVVVAVPWLHLHMIQLEPPLPADAWDALTSIRRGDYSVVHFLVDKQIHTLWGGAENHPFPVLTPGPLGVIYGTEPTPPGQPLEVFSLLVHGARADAFHLTPHDEKRRELLAELEHMWPGFARFVRSASIYTYHPAAIPYWPQGRSPFDERAQRLFRAFDGLYLAGDYLVSSHSEGAVVAAQRQAKAIALELTGSGGQR